MFNWFVQRSQIDYGHLKMRRLAAALLAMLIAICVSLAVIMLILWLRHGDANVNDPEIIKIGSNATMGGMLFAFFRAWRNPDSFFSFFQKIPNLLKPTSLNNPLKRLMSLVFIAGFMISLMTFAIYVINDNS